MKFDSSTNRIVGSSDNLALPTEKNKAFCYPSSSDAILFLSESELSMNLAYKSGRKMCSNGFSILHDE